jgi:23S rRNA (guanosine2251-2'-O)-methyltransferase
MTRQAMRARQCTACRLRFPLADGSPLGARCPICGAPTEWVDDAWLPEAAPPPVVAPRGTSLALLVDNVRSLRNVGSMFRTADGAGITRLWLGGITPTPDHPKLAKTALGAERVVPWSHDPDACGLAARLHAEGHRLWALEGGPRSQSLFDPEVLRAAAGSPLVLVVGHEVSGIDPRIQALCERVVHLPMEGVKTSLNVSVALGIAAYVLRHVCAE